MPTPKEAIAEALRSLDHTNDALWTDDGAPLVNEIQRLTNDNKITRAQINEALPGFARKSAESIGEDEQPGDEADAEAEVASTETIAPSSDVQEDDGERSPEMEHERLRQLAYQRVQDAEAAIIAAKNAVSDAQRAVVHAEQRHARAMQVFSSKYPPLSSAENIKLHLLRQQEVLRERVTGSRFEPNLAQNPVDARLMDRKRDNGRNGQSKPTSFLPRKASVSY